MATPTLAELAIRLTTVDGVGAAVPSSADIPTIEADLNGLHTTIQQLSLIIQSQLNTLAAQVTQLQTGLSTPISGGNGTTWTSGTGAPSGTAVSGSLYSRISGGAMTSLYVYNGTTWTAVA